MSSNYLPAEWAEQDAVLLTWPHAEGDWGPWLAQVERVFVKIAHEVSLRARLVISCYDRAYEDSIRSLLLEEGIAAARFALYVAPSNDSWVRDHGPITVLDDGAPRLLDFRFNGWGGKFESKLDNTLTRRLHNLGALGTTPLEAIDLVLEGGSIEVDGANTLLTTSSCLLSPQRNPTLGCHEIEARLKELFGLKRVLWLEHGRLIGDDTDGHIDTLARFCDSTTICYVACDDVEDENYASLKAMEEELTQLRTLEGASYRLLPLPWPQAKYDSAGQRLPATYANFFIINGAVLVPTYTDPADVEALARLRECFPRHEVIGIPCLPLLMQYGSLHCVTMQLPAGVLPEQHARGFGSAVFKNDYHQGTTKIKIGRFSLWCLRG